MHDYLDSSLVKSFKNFSKSKSSPPAAGAGAAAAGVGAGASFLALGQAAMAVTDPKVARASYNLLVFGKCKSANQSK